MVASERAGEVVASFSTDPPEDDDDDTDESSYTTVNDFLSDDSSDSVSLLPLPLLLLSMRSALRIVITRGYL